MIQTRELIREVWDQSPDGKSTLSHMQICEVEIRVSKGSLDAPCETEDGWRHKYGEWRLLPERK